MGKVETKTCIKCEVDKPLTEYHVAKASKDGHVNTCKECSATYDQQRGQTLHRKASLALKDSRKARRTAEQASGQPIEDTLTLSEVLTVFSSDECAYCSQEVPEMERTLDHINSMKYGGGNTFENTCMACRSCNSAKNDLPAITYFLQSCSSEEASKVVAQVALKSNRTFAEAFAELTEHAKEYYAIQAERATERAVS